MQLYYKSAKRASNSNRFRFIAFIMLSVKIGSAQMALVTPNPNSRLGQSSGRGTSIYFGIISAVLVFVIIVIAIVALIAKRNSERYGPQPARPGQPKQSRAKGLARAVLESIPIVRFRENDRDANATAQRDIELAVTGRDNRTQSTTVDANSLSPDPDAIIVNSNRSTYAPAMTSDGLSAAQPAFQTLPGQLECSICLEDFVKKEEIRVLPCNHKFHPVCIDPWLLNISGTCPIW